MLKDIEWISQTKVRVMERDKRQAQYAAERRERDEQRKKYLEEKKAREEEIKRQ